MKDLDETFRFIFWEGTNNNNKFERIVLKIYIYGFLSRRASSFFRHNNGNSNEEATSILRQMREIGPMVVLHLSHVLLEKEQHSILVFSLFIIRFSKNNLEMIQL